MSDREPAAKLLVVDDIEENLVALTAILPRDGITVVTARSGPEALEALLVHEFALALIDVHMPVMDGFELAELMRGTERTRHVPIIFVTADSGETSHMFEGYEAGAVDFLFKPLDARLLRSKVDTFVRLHRQTQQMSQQLSQLQQMLRLSDMFIAVLGHDLRSPLQSIDVCAHMLAGGSPERPMPVDRALIDRCAKAIQTSSRRMNRLIEHILEFARARIEGRIPVVPGPCDLAEVVRAAVAELEPAAAARVATRLVGDPLGTWDRDRMLQVLTNLTRNASVHGDPERPISIEVDGEQAGTVRISAQNGGTIPAELMERLFDPFASAERPGKRNRGLGLGLYIVDQIVRAHGGRIEVESDPGIGTRFRIELPRHVEGAVGRGAGAAPRR
jgi:signal transduction histidine kinase